MIARLSLEKDHATIIFAYAPTLMAQPEVKDLFYAALAQVVESVPKSDKLILLGDFNARVGNDRESWPVTIGAFGIGKINENGQRLLNLVLNSNSVSLTPTHNAKTITKSPGCIPYPRHGIN